VSWPDRIRSAARAVAALAPTLSGPDTFDAEYSLVRAAVDRGHFTPAEDERLWAWYARYLTARRGLQEVIHELRPAAGAAEEEESSLRAFFVAYTASALLVRTARFLVEELATDALVRRKLNERHVGHRIPRKQFTAVYRNLTDPLNAYRLHEAVQQADRLRQRFAGLEPELLELIPWLERSEQALRVAPDDAIVGRLRYRWHSGRRRGASTLKLARFKILEAGGRVISELKTPWHRQRVTARTLQQLSSILCPGDVLVTRRHNAFTNLFLPGFWPHGMLYLGDRSPDQAKPILEARKDGVRLRSMADALRVDAFSVVRPATDESATAAAIARALTHRDKLYDFDFDFFTSDRMVCTELIYRTYDGSPEIHFELIERAGKPTLSAEDILWMAVESRGFEPLAVFGVRGTRRRLVSGEPARALIRKSLETSGATRATI
jgi:hypothetical protein